MYGRVAGRGGQTDEKNTTTDGCEVCWVGGSMVREHMTTVLTWGLSFIDRV